jgi:hypothetical protein
MGRGDTARMSLPSQMRRYDMNGVHSHIQSHRGHFQISSQWASRKNRFAFISFGKIQFLPPCIWDFLLYRSGDLKCREVKTEYIAMLPPFSPIEGCKWFFQFPANESLRRTGLHLLFLGKIQFLPPCFEIFHSCCTASILWKEINSNQFFWDSHWLEIWKNRLCPSMGPNGGGLAMDSEAVWHEWEISNTGR